MPAPVAITEDFVSPALIRKSLADSNVVRIFYATNRKPSATDDSSHYILDFDQTLRIGVASVRIGDKGLPTDEIFRQTVSADRESEIPLYLEQVSQQSEIASDQKLDDLSDQTRAYLKGINAVLAKSKNRDIIVYVHGANTPFYRSAAHAAQFSYFSGRQSVILAYSWPSTGSLLRYGVDVENSAQSYEVFARLIKLLSRYTDARFINIFSYSAGARVASPALNLLSQEQASLGSDEVRHKLRLGIVYYAEPDEYQRTFFRNLTNYLHLTESVTVTVNFHDSVLALAEAFSGKPDAGRPDPTKWTEKEQKYILKKLNRPNFHVINIDSANLPGLARGEHGAWYFHPWASTDVIIQFLYHLNPSERGLVLKKINRPWKKYWIYPKDYPARVRALAPVVKSRAINTGQ